MSSVPVITIEQHYPDEGGETAERLRWLERHVRIEFNFSGLVFEIGGFMKEVDCYPKTIVFDFDEFRLDKEGDDLFVLTSYNHYSLLEDENTDPSGTIKMNKECVKVFIGALSKYLKETGIKHRDKDQETDRDIETIFFSGNK